MPDDDDRKISRILCATDTSEASQHAVYQAAALALHLDADLTLIYVSATAEDNRDIPPMLAALREMKRLAEEMLRHDRAALAVLLDRARSNGARVESHIAFGDAADEVSKAAVELGADLVITGTHGRTGVSKFLLGSTAERIIRISTVPVIVARNPDYVPEHGYGKILVPTDFSENAEKAFYLASCLAADECEIELMHCWDLPSGVGSGPASVVETIERSFDREVRARGEAAIAKLASPGLRVTFHAERVPATQGVIDRASERDFDLVVMGSHGRSGLSRFLLGSVAETTIHHATCSVATVPELAE